MTSKEIEAALLQAARAARDERLKIGRKRARLIVRERQHERVGACFGERHRQRGGEHRRHKHR